jgi:hypothetical protein
MCSVRVGPERPAAEHHIGKGRASVTTTTVPVLPPWFGTPGVGVVPLRPLSGGEILDGGMDVLRRHPGPTLGISAVMVAIQLLITVPLWWAVSSLLNQPDNSSGSALTAILLVLATLTAASVVSTLGSTLAAVITIAATAFAISLESAGQPVSLAAVWSLLRPHLGRLLLLALTLTAINAVLALIPVVGWLVPLIGGVLRLSTLAVVYERAPIRAALRRGMQASGSGTSGGLARQLGIRTVAGVVGVLVWFMGFVPLAALLSAVGVIDDSDPGGGGLLVIAGTFAIAYYLPLVVVWAFRSGVDTLLYLDGRMRAEALDVEWGLATRRARLGRNS